jgi:hypothetical protein
VHFIIEKDIKCSEGEKMKRDGEDLLFAKDEI